MEDMNLFNNVTKKSIFEVAIKSIEDVKLFSIVLHDNFFDFVEVWDILDNFKNEYNTESNYFQEFLNQYCVPEFLETGKVSKYSDAVTICSQVYGGTYDKTMRIIVDHLKLCEKMVNGRECCDDCSISICKDISEIVRRLETPYSSDNMCCSQSLYSIVKRFRDSMLSLSK